MRGKADLVLNDPCGYLWVDGVRVTLPGRQEAIEAKESEQLDTRMHGVAEGVWEGRQ